MIEIFKQKKIIFSVLIVHFCALILIYLFNNNFSSPSLQNNKITENIIIIKKERKKIAQIPLKTKINAKKPIQKIEKKQVTKKKIPKNLVEDLKKITQNLNENKKDIKKNPSSSKLVIPKLSNIKIENYENNNLSSFQDKLSNFFKSHLTLPENGEIKLKLSINKEGSIQIVNVLFSKNDKNLNYLINSLKKLKIDFLDEHKKEIVLNVSFIND